MEPRTGTGPTGGSGGRRTDASPPEQVTRRRIAVQVIRALRSVFEMEDMARDFLQRYVREFECIAETGVDVPGDPPLASRDRAVCGDGQRQLVDRADRHRRA